MIINDLVKEIDNFIKKIENSIDKSSYKPKVKEIGKIESVGDGVFKIIGLENLFYGEIVIVNKKYIGMVQKIQSDGAFAVSFADSEASIKAGDFVVRTKDVPKIKVSEKILGRQINAIGESLDGKKITISSGKEMLIEKRAYGVMPREEVNEPLFTGIKSLDGIVPIGKGQRELIIGDRKTGKTQIAIDTIANQKGKNVKCIYVAIGQKRSTIANIVAELKKRNALDYTVIVSASASDPAPLKFLAPYTGTAIGEYFMDKGEDALIIYDDLTKHAIAYREMSLLLEKPPGREAYPGDIFYVHSKLLERAAKLNKKYGGGSLTALPIIETQAGDISAYVPTNVISITDGQIFLQSELFNSGFMPAIDAGLSVSRVGSSAQTKALKNATKAVKLELSRFNEIKGFTKFASDIDEATSKQLEKGKRLQEGLKQNIFSPLNYAEMTVIFYTLLNDLANSIPVNKIKEYEKFLIEKISKKTSYKLIMKTKDLNDQNKKTLHDDIILITEEFVKKYV